MKISMIKPVRKFGLVFVHRKTYLKENTEMIYILKVKVLKHSFFK